MNEGIKITGLEELSSLFEKMSRAASNLDKLDGQKIMVDGVPVNTDIPIKADRLSKTDEEAISEAGYVSIRKKGEKFTVDKQEYIQRYIRDYLEKVGKGLF
jgi:hypothetical protein